MSKFVAWNTLTMSLLKSQPSIVGDHCSGVEQTINDVVPSLTMPESHDQEQSQVTEVSDIDTILDPLVFDHCKHQTHVDEITEPE